MAAPCYTVRIYILRIVWRGIVARCGILQEVSAAQRVKICMELPLSRSNSYRHLHVR